MKLQKLILVLLLFLSFHTFSQGEVAMEVISTNYTTSKKEGGANVRVYEGGTQVSSTTTAGNGATVLTLDAGKIYKIEVSKPGKVTRFVMVDTKAVNDELIQGSAQLKGAVSISLFDENPNVDFSYVTQNQITTFYYDGKTPELVYKADEAAKMKAQIEKLLKNADADAKAAEAAYNAAIKAADAFYAQKKYNEAIAEYEKASMAKPKEPYPAKQIADIEAIQKAENAGNEAKQQAETDYQNLITAANTLRDQKKYTEAKAKYQEALLKKQEQYPKDEIAKLDIAIANAAKDAENKKVYDAAMAAGNSFFGQKSWMAAKDEYKKALKAIPNDPAATAKMAEIDGKLNAQKEEQAKKDNYEKLVTEADALFTEEKFADAKAKYNEALKIIPSSQHPTQRVAECDTKIAAADALKAKQVQIDKLLAEGTTAFTANQLPAAKTKFQEVLKLDAENAAAKAKIDEIDKKIADEKANADKIASAKALVAEGDALAKSAKHQEAITKYNAAQAIYNDPAVQPKIDASNAALKASQDAAAKKASFDKAIEEGNAALTAKNYDGAKAKYNEAAGIDATSTVPKAKLAEVDKMIAADKTAADAAAKKASFDKAIQDGDAALATKNYDAAKAKYNEAAGIDATSAVPKSKIAEVDKMIAADKSAADAVAKKAAFDKAIQEGDAALAAKKYDEAKAKYNEAAKADATSAIPKEKLASVDKIIADEKSAADAAAKKANYDKALSEGNALFDAKDYTAAKAKYNEAVAIDGSRNEAKDKLAQITKLASDQAALEQQKKQYDAAVADGTSLLTSGKLIEAKAKFVEANKIDATQQLPVQKLAEIDEMIALENQKKEVSKLLAEGNTALGAKKFADAKTKYNAVLALDSKNEEAKTKLQEAIDGETALMGEQAKLAKFQSLKAEGIALMGQSKYVEAKAKLTEAKAIQADSEVDKKITECDAKLAELAKGAEADQKYAQLMTQAKALEASNKLDEAIAKYNEALAVKNEQEPKDRIEAIKTLKDGQANAAKLDEEFNKLVKQGDDAMASTTYEAAITAYDLALSKKNDPAVAAKKAEAVRLNKEKGTSEEEAQYQKILAAGQKAIDEKNYSRAIEMYNRAITNRATDPFPKQKLDEINNLMKAEADLKAKNDAYQAKVTEAEAAAKSGKIENAISLFETAKTIKPDEVLPANRIAELKAQLASQTVTVDPQVEIDKKYQAAMSAGNTFAQGKDYNGAIGKYQEALGVKPNDKEATAKIAEMRQILDDINAANKNKAELDQLIAAADKLFKAGDWLAAKNAYDLVLVKDASNSYSKSQIVICQKNLDTSRVNAEDKEYQKLVSVADKNFDKADYKKAKEYYERATNIRKSDPYPKRRLLEIEALLNPKPVVVQQPPVSKEPEKLANLGTPSSSTEEEDGAKLERAKIARKYRNRNKVEAIRDSATVASREGAGIQNERTTDMNSQFAELKKGNELRADSADIGRNENIAEIRKTDAEMAATSTELAGNKTSDIQYTNGQLDLIRKDVNEQNGVYDQSSLTNAEIVKQNKLDHDATNSEVSANSYQENILTDVILSDLKVEQKAKSISDTEERLVVRDQLVEITKENQDKQTDLANDKTQTLYRTNSTIEDVNNERNKLSIEDQKQSPNNQEKIEQINKETAERTVAESQEHQQNMLYYKQIIEEDKKAQYEYAGNAQEQRNATIAEVTEIKKEQQETDRVNYNNVYVKSVNNKTDIEATKVVQGEYSKLPSIATASNAAVYTEIRNQNLEKGKEDQATEYAKYTGNQSNINEIKDGTAEQNTAGQAKSSSNADLLNEKKTGLGDTDKKLAQDQQKKNLDAKQTLTNIENAEPIVGTKAPNDLGKLYPEGVSQEKFDQTDKNNMVIAIVTRRVVVEAGHGDEYIKTQSLNATTYTKNGVAITENTWLKDTQSAKLVKNY